MKPIRRDENAIAVPLLVIIFVVLLALVFVGLYAAGYLSPSVGANCPPSVCPLGGDKPVWIRVDVTGTVVPNTGSSPSIQPGSLGIVAAISTTPASLVHPPQLIFDETWNIGGTVSVSYPNGETHSYSLPSASGINQQDFDLLYFVQGPHGSYTISATISLQQTGCWLGCAPPTQSTVTGHFNL